MASTTFLTAWGGGGTDEKASTEKKPASFIMHGMRKKYSLGQILKQDVHRNSGDVPLAGTVQH
ncbi:hypothetical protein [Bacillus sp. OTU530]|uniref:hypothetical protein n=1 Tax=Bacillus sp. OTU530 TaxID=3043862 RepID=UPI00313D4D4C